MKRPLLLKAIFLALPFFSLAQVSYNQQTIGTLLRNQNSSLSQQDVSDIEITNTYTSEHNKVTHIYFRQKVNGIPVFNSISSVHFTSDGQPVQVNCDFIANAQQIANTANPILDISAALVSAGQHIQMNLAPVLGKASSFGKQTSAVINDVSVSQEPIKIKQVYFYDGSRLRLSWNVEVFDQEKNDWWEIRVDAQDGNILDKNNFVTKCSIHHDAYKRDFSSMGSERVATTQHFHKKSANGSYRIYPIPYESPIHGGRELISSQAKAKSSPYGWHDTDGVAGADWTITRGNNVWAKEDTLNRNGAGYSPDGGADLVFDYTIDTTWMNPRLSLNAAITNLFVWNNLVHDIFYEYGFNEQSGNFQSNNYGKGGLGGDAVHADAQDGSGTSNANFSAPADGSRGRMQMYLWPVGGAASAPPMRINAPASMVANYPSPISQFGPKKFPSITGNLVMMNDSLGCAAATNASAIAGKIAIIYRGTCGFTQKVKNAQNAGAIAAVVINNSANTPTSMTGFDNTITIPSYIIAQTIGRQIADTLRKGDSVNVTLQGTPDVKTYDSDFDNGVIAHEFGHGISIRLTGGPANSSCLNNQEQAGEGWSDFFALALTAKSTDKAEDGRGIGTYVANQATNGLGIRTFRYSRSLTVSDNTSYNDVKTLSVPHGVGSVWCVMLWDIFWDMVDKYGFNEDLYAGNGGNNKTIQLVIDGLKLQPCNPGFVDSRNAILKADSINNGGANYELLWRAFARRGLGYSASQGLTSSRTDGTESFDLPPNIVNTGVQKLNAISGIKMAPNPSEGWINILFPEAIQSAKLQVYDISGKCVFTQDIVNTDNQRVSLQNMENGIYFVEIKDNKGNVFQQKLILAK